MVEKSYKNQKKKKNITTILQNHVKNDNLVIKPTSNISNIEVCRSSFHVT